MHAQTWDPHTQASTETGVSPFTETTQEQGLQQQQYSHHLLCTYYTPALPTSIYSTDDGIYIHMCGCIHAYVYDSIHIVMLGNTWYVYFAVEEN